MKIGTELITLGGNFYELIINENTTEEDVFNAFRLLEEAHENVHLVIGNDQGDWMHLFHNRGSNKIDRKEVTRNKFDFTDNKVEWTEKENVQPPKKISNRELKRQRGREKALARQNKKLI